MFSATRFPGEGVDAGEDAGAGDEADPGAAPTRRTLELPATAGFGASFLKNITVSRTSLVETED